MQLANPARLLTIVAIATSAIISDGCGGATSAAKPATTGSGSPSAPGAAPADPPPPNTTTVDNLQNKSGWQFCSATTSTGATCAAGLGTAVSWMAQNQAQPSLDGHSAQIFIGGSTGYSNALWWKSLGSNSSPTHFDYDFWVYAPTPGVSEAIEFDVNQSFNGTRWIFGTECNFRGTGHWDVWDSSKLWVQTKLGCPVLPANTWVHFTWHFERSGSQVHYISLTINGVDYPVDTWTAAQPNWSGTDVNVAVQLDGDSTQQPYSIFVDEMALTYW